MLDQPQLQLPSFIQDNSKRSILGHNMLALCLNRPCLHNVLGLCMGSVDCSIRDLLCSRSLWMLRYLHPPACRTRRSAAQTHARSHAHGTSAHANAGVDVDVVNNVCNIENVEKLEVLSFLLLMHMLVPCC